MSKTYGEQFKEALACRNTAEADFWLEGEIDVVVADWNAKGDADYRRKSDFAKRLKAKETILNNLGYMAGYYDSATAKKISELFGAKHPIFGTDSYFEDVTPEQAFKKGQDWAKNNK